jgi:hypothetical protein
VIVVANDLPTWELRKHAIEHELQHVAADRARLFQAKIDGEAIEKHPFQSYGACMLAMYSWRSRTAGDVHANSVQMDHNEKVRCPPYQGK